MNATVAQPPSYLLNFNLMSFLNVPPFRRTRGRTTSESNKVQSLARLAGIEIPEGEKVPGMGRDKEGQRRKRTRDRERSNSRL